jgi:hypothetical protein
VCKLPQESLVDADRLHALSSVCLCGGLAMAERGLRHWHRARTAGTDLERDAEGHTKAVKIEVSVVAAEAVLVHECAVHLASLETGRASTSTILTFKPLTQPEISRQIGLETLWCEWIAWL